MTRASYPPPFFDEDFEYLSANFLHRAHGITKDEFTVSNISDIYDHLVGYYCAD